MGNGKCHRPIQLQTQLVSGVPSHHMLGVPGPILLPLNRSVSTNQELRLQALTISGLEPSRLRQVL